MGGLDTAWQALLAFGGSRIKAKLRTKSRELKGSYFFNYFFERTFSFVFEISGKIHKSAHNK